MSGTVLEVSKQSCFCPCPLQPILIPSQKHSDDATSHENPLITPHVTQNQNLTLQWLKRPTKAAPFLPSLNLFPTSLPVLFILWWPHPFLSCSSNSMFCFRTLAPAVPSLWSTFLLDTCMACSLSYMLLPQHHLLDGIFPDHSLKFLLFILALYIPLSDLYFLFSS